MTLANKDRRRVESGDELYQPVVDFLDYLEHESDFTPVGQVRR